VRIRKKPPEKPQEPFSAPESAEKGYEPLFPTKRLREAPSGLIVAYDEMTQEQRKQRRADNKKMKLIHSKTRRRKRHGRQ